MVTHDRVVGKTVSRYAPRSGAAVAQKPITKGFTALVHSAAPRCGACYHTAIPGRGPGSTDNGLALRVITTPAGGDEAHSAGLKWKLLALACSNMAERAIGRIAVALCDREVRADTKPFVPEVRHAGGRR